MNEGIKGVIQDRTIYEDVEIFAKNLYKMKIHYSYLYQL